MTSSITSSELALLHHLQAAATGTQLPKQVAHELEQQGLVELLGASPGQAGLTAAGRERLDVLAARQAASGQTLP
jgi:hypothetical protein